MKLNELARQVHIANEKWWQDPATQKPIPRNPFELLALTISELSEGLEGERKNLMDDKLPHRLMAEVEMADTYIRLLDFSAGFGHKLTNVLGVGLLVPKNKGEALFKIMQTICRIGNRLSFGGDGVGDAISVALYQIEKYCETHGYDLDGAMKEKMAFNATRQDHTHEARLIAGGKQF